MTHTTTRRGFTQPENAVMEQRIIPELISGSSTPAVTQVPGKQQAWKTLKKFQGLCLFDKNRHAADPRLDPALQPCGTDSLGMTPDLMLGNIGQVKPDAGRKQTRKLSGSRLTYKCYGGFTARFVTPQGFCAGYSGRVGFTLIELLVVVLIIGILAAVALPQYNRAVKKAQGREVYAVIDALDKSLSDYYLEYGNYYNASADRLSVQIPNLTHFWFHNARGPLGFERSHQFQVGSRTFDSEYWVEIVGESGCRVELKWAGGKLLNGVVVGRECAQYFDCPYVSPQASSGDPKYECKIR